MSTFFVRTTEVEFDVDGYLVADLFDALPIDTNIINRFPFCDEERKKLEIYAIGSEEDCQVYIDAIDKRIKGFFTAEEFTEQDKKNSLIQFFFEANSV